MKTVIITGCAGLIGNNFSRYLLGRDYQVIGIDDLSGGYKDYLPLDHKNFEFLQFDLSDRNKSDFNFKYINNKYGDIKTIFHFAAYAAEGLSPFIRHYNYTNNVLASANVINACIQYGMKIVFTSSMAVYGNQDPPFDESFPAKPIDPYGIAKYTIEQDIKVANHQHGISYNIVRPHNVIGIYQNIWDRYRNVAGIFIRKALKNEPLLIYGSGTQMRAFSDIKYYMKPFEKLIDDKFNGLTFNIGADKACTINNLADTVIEIAAKFGINASKKYAQPRHEVHHAFCDHTLAKNELKFVDETDLSVLIYEMFNWVRLQPDRNQRSMEYEVNKGLYEFWK